ncbi:uncharacterized protein NECHADRAFT_75798 [Fusarium vanettenii 77-13-4]|uniref:Zn(2)-C6 fungal-type domain-containing protein n=1 Tax=Fusarium vanettenii (strain ATCC MYA-4622 / CBS 123669 / FGSC 9596 / NRRL 45880 / 77-13-4) TaxID=660122 RepID=C7YJU2_FUSV7|nr:uncharacterized protein NECHADRAFT_75798 [Fusarium vanettenii 77-13-4]EEU49036.1 predicted protein [Fusarium vanettenii 77-13-4]
MQQERSNAGRRKRVSNACQRCRQLKVKCSGTQPCRACTHKGCRCDFVSDDRNILVSERSQPSPHDSFLCLQDSRSLVNLRKRLDNIERNRQAPASPQDSDPSPPTLDQSSPLCLPQASRLQECVRAHHSDEALSQPLTETTQDVGATDQTVSSPDDASPEDADVSNPLVPDQPSYMSDYSGRLRYLGHSSTWSFSYQVLQMASQSAGLLSSPSASMQMHVDGQIYDVIPERQIELSPADIAHLPSLELAMYYLQSTKFRTYPLFYLFEETEFMQNIQSFYQNPSEFARMNSLWYVHFLVIMAFGKSFVGQQATIGPAGSNLFSRALSLLPDVTYLSRDPVKATEIFCSIALYLHCVDHRVAAHSYIGQAVRMAQSHGLHTDMQPVFVGDRLAYHGCRLWWTLYTLDRKLSSLMGVPNAILDEDITAPIPQVTGNDSSMTALSIHVKTSQLLGSIATTVYGPKERLNKTYLSTIRKVLKGIAGLSDELASFSSQCFGDVSRVAAHLNLGYSQCIVLTTRPILFHLYKHKVETLHAPGEFTLLPSIRELIQVLTNSAVHVANILSQLKKHSLLDILLPFDLESAYSAAFVLITACAVDAKHPLHEVSLAALLEIFDAMILAGSLAASSRKAEVEELAFSLQRQLHKDGSENDVTEPTVPNQTSDATFVGQFGLPSPGGTFFEGWSPGNLGPDSRIGDLADSLTMNELDDLWA